LGNEKGVPELSETPLARGRRCGDPEGNGTIWRRRAELNEPGHAKIAGGGCGVATAARGTNSPVPSPGKRRFR